MRPGGQDYVDFLRTEVYPVLFARLDTVFPEFGWKRDARGWTATNREHTKAIVGGRPDRVVCHVAYGFLVHGGTPTPWLAYLNGGTWPTGRAFVEKVKELASRAGVSPPPERELSPEELKRQDERNRRESLLEAFAAVTHEALIGEKGEAARAYLVERHLMDAADAFGLYPSREAVLSALMARGYTRDELAAVKLTEGFYFDSWAGRLVIPWRDRWGHLGTFAARDLTGKAEHKYLYMVERKKPHLFGLAHALGTKEGRDHLVLVEGLPDVVHLQALGFPNVAAIGGDGANLTTDKWAELAAEGVQAVTLALDNDPKEDGTWPGREGTVAAVKNLRKVRKVRNSGNVPVVYVVDPVHLGTAKDPDELVRAKDLEAFRAVLDKKVNAHRFMADELVRKSKTGGEGKDEALSTLLQDAKGYDASADVEEGPELAAFFWPVIAAETGVSPESMRAVLLELRETRVKHEAAEEKKRSLLAAAETAASNLKAGNVEKGSSVMKAAVDALRVQERRASVDPVLSVAEEVDTHRAHLEKWRGVDFLGLPQKTLPTLDKYTSGLRGLMLLAARPGVGKTVLGVQLGVDVVRNNPDACFLFVSMEMNRRDIMTRLLCRLSGLPWRTLVFGHEERYDEAGNLSRFSAHETYLIKKAERELEKWGGRVRILDSRNFPEPTVEGVLAHLRNLKEKTGTTRAFVLVDYLQVWPIPTSEGRTVKSDLDADKYRIGTMRDLRDGSPEDAVLVISEARKPASSSASGKEWGGELEDVMGSARGTYTPDMVFLFRPFTEKELKEGNVSEEDMTREGKQGGQERAFNKLSIPKGRDGVRRGELGLTFFYNLSSFTEGVDIKEEP